MGDTRRSGWIEVILGLTPSSGLQWTCEGHCGLLEGFLVLLMLAFCDCGKHSRRLRNWLYIVNSVLAHDVNKCTI
jgi:hypothetical protein